MPLALKPAHQSKSKRTRRELESWVSRLEDETQKRFAQVDQNSVAVAKSVQTIWANQKELVKSEELLDEQFAVSTRMSIMAVNQILEAMDSDKRIEASDVEKLFKDWATFRARPDYRKYMMEWFLGVALDTLPPPPEIQTLKEESSNAESNQRKQDESSPDSGQAVDVPKVPQKDCSQAGDQG
jgi:hypothetical protein